MGTRKIIPRQCAAKCGRRPAAGSLFCAECSRAADTAARVTQQQLPADPPPAPAPAAPQQAELVVGPPTLAEADALGDVPRPRGGVVSGVDLLAIMARSDERGRTRGFVEGALFVLGRVLTRPADMASTLAELRRMFGDREVDWALQQRPNVRALAGETASES